ncbi:MAG: hypothetical protein AAGI66_05015 [Cyanobacteria bacterium P01_H01_bin.74]
MTTSLKNYTLILFTSVGLSLLVFVNEINVITWAAKQKTIPFVKEEIPNRQQKLAHPGFQQVHCHQSGSSQTAIPLTLTDSTLSQSNHNPKGFCHSHDNAGAHQH